MQQKEHYLSKELLLDLSARSVCIHKQDFKKPIGASYQLPVFV